MSLARRRLTAIALVAVAVACATKDSTAPEQKTDAKSSFTGTTGAVFSQPSDTVSNPSGPAVLHGDVILMTVVPSGGGMVDTSQTAPLAGAPLKLSQKSASGVETIIAQTVSASDGTFSFGTVPEGNYLLTAQGPDSKPCYPATAYVSTTAADIAVHFRLVAK